MTALYFAPDQIGGAGYFAPDSPPAESGNAPGATLTGVSTLIPGAATGGGTSATAPGATLTGTSTLIAGAASSVEYARAPSGDGYPIKHTVSFDRPAATQGNTR